MTHHADVVMRGQGRAEVTTTSDGRVRIHLETVAGAHCTMVYPISHAVALANGLADAIARARTLVPPAVLESPR